MNTELILESSRQSLLIIEERKRKDIVIGVPHHAPAGISQLPCPKHRVADENAGFIGLDLARKLNSCSIIASNYMIDANKHESSDYSQQIKRWEPDVLVEIHGHGARSARFDIEISSGSRTRDRYSKALAEELSRRMQQRWELKHLTVSGDYGKIYFTASRSVTITDRSHIAYHIELPPTIRKPHNGGTERPGKLGALFVEVLLQSLRTLHG